VALAEIGRMPARESAPNVMNVPPPATALTAPERKPARKSMAAMAVVISGVSGGGSCRV